MKKNICICLALTVFLSIAACTTALKKDEIDPWLQGIAGDRAPEIHIEGWWKDAHTDAVFGWGRGRFEQDGNKLTGSLGDYNVEGRVSGDTVYLVFLSRGAVHYTARLKMMEDDLLSGSYYHPDDREQENGTPITLEKFER